MSVPIIPGRSVDWITLGASLHNVLTRIKAQPVAYPKISLAYSSTDPVQEPITVSLPHSGLRLQFDGPDQRLRLIEIVDFSQLNFSFKNTDLIRNGPNTSGQGDGSDGPTFRHLYSRVLGPSYAGEYIPPKDGNACGVYILSWPGIAARFSVRHESYSEKTNFVSILSLPTTSPATSMAIFQGQSWPEIRDVLFTQSPNLPRSIALATHSGDIIADEVENIVVHSSRRLVFYRRAQSSFSVILGRTTAQDVLADLGPPDAIFQKSATDVTVQATQADEEGRQELQARLQTKDREHSHAASDLPAGDTNRSENNGFESFWNYFYHGLDVLMAPANGVAGHLVVKKVFLHGNIPGSYSFNRYRRSQWSIDLADYGDFAPINASMPYSIVKETLREVFHDRYTTNEEEEKMMKGMILNRGWETSPESSIELLGEFEHDIKQSKMGIGVARSTEIFGFPGLLFEVTANGSVVCLTVY